MNTLYFLLQSTLYLIHHILYILHFITFYFWPKNHFKVPVEIYFSDRESERKI